MNDNLHRQTFAYGQQKEEPDMPRTYATAEEIANTAAALVSGDRQQMYGDVVANHENIAKLWSAYLDIDLEAHDVAMLVALLKVARIKGTSGCAANSNAFNLDSYVDGSAYLAIAGEIKQREVAL